MTSDIETVYNEVDRLFTIYTIWLTESVAFTVGETITGDSSGAFGTILTIIDTGKYTVGVVVGTFTAEEDVSGNIAGDGSITVGYPTSTQTYNGSFYTASRITIDEADIAIPRYFIDKEIDRFSDNINKHVVYPVIIESSTMELRDQMIDAFLKKATRNPDGYKSKISGNPIWFSIEHDQNYEDYNINSFISKIIITSIWGLL